MVVCHEVVLKGCNKIWLSANCTASTTIKVKYISHMWSFCWLYIDFLQNVSLDSIPSYTSSSAEMHTRYQLICMLMWMWMCITSFVLALKSITISFSIWLIPLHWFKNVTSLRYIQCCSKRELLCQLAIVHHGTNECFCKIGFSLMWGWGLQSNVKKMDGFGSKRNAKAKTIAVLCRQVICQLDPHIQHSNVL